ncbi:hypothetical protein BBO99_00007926 [Phytophthora kernoviae]|uniref:Uncharacterized protein n=1 Tax=Phytophthora kernoviae TaxID=325452 RepID=A0A421F6G2_9STRA|nr:hypothetical protein BBI17_007917 [Phytophthora kernoviae]RLN75952.1 hypothetical protein BBO99_00007926 [Phytophthora kernoviae]
MTTVTVIEKFLLQCADESSLQNLESPMFLGPLDQLALAFVPISVVFVYPHEASSTREVIPLKRLRHALARLLDYYPHLTGRVTVNQKDHTAQIEHLGSGGKLVSAKCGEPLNAFQGVTENDKPDSPPRLIAVNLPDGGNALLPLFDSTEEVAIGLRIRHVICDAAGFFQLVEDLGALYRCLSTGADVMMLPRPPCIRPYQAELHDMTPDEREEAQKFHPAAFKLTPEVQPSATNGLAPPPTTGRLIRFSAIELAAIKTEANTSNNDRTVSTFVALTAHIWKCVHRARVHLCETQGMSSNEAARHVPRQFLTSVNARNQLVLPSRYFPNCVLCPVFSLSAEQLLEAPLSSVAASVRDRIELADPKELEQSLRWISAQPNKRRVQLAFDYSEGGFLVSQWSKFGMYRGAEFDSFPALVVQPFTPINLVDGLVYFMATEDELNQSDASVGATTGSLDVAIALSEPVWAVLDQDVNFRRYRGW